MIESPSLSLNLSVAGDTVVLTCSDEMSGELGRLATHFSSQSRRSPLALEVDVGEFLDNLSALSDWPSQDVTWAPMLEHLLRTNLSDAKELGRQLSQLEEPIALWEAPPGWEGPLTSFQIRDISRLLQLSHGANFSVPGAGKTRVGLAVYASRKAAGRVSRLLIVAPKSAFSSWQEENLICFGDSPLAMEILQGEIPPCEALVVNYERLPQSAVHLANWLRAQPSMMIVDEGHRMKRGQSGAHGRVVLGLAPLARSRLILTGTPAPNGVADLQNVLSFPWPGAGQRQVQQATARGSLRAASQMLKPLFVRTTKSELGLPAFEPKLVPVELPPLHRRVYDALVGHFAAEAPDLARLGRIVMYLLMAADCPSLIPRGTTQYEPLNYAVPPLNPGDDPELRTIMRDLPDYEVSPKYLAAVSLATRNAELGRKTIVWSTFVRSLTSLQLLMAPLRPAVVHGGTDDRESQLARFKADPNCHVLLSNPATLGEGISLHHVSNDAVYVDRDFAAGRYLQSLDRIHRLGLPPNAQIHVTVLSAVGTIDEVVQQRLSAKLRFMGAVLDDPDVEELADLNEDPDIAAGLSPDDRDDILKHLVDAAS